MTRTNYRMKYRMGNKWLIAVGLWLLAIAGASASPMHGIPKRPNPPRLVNNFSAYQILSSDETNQLETKLDAFANSTSNQIAIVIIDSLYDNDPSEFATEIGQEWQIGQKKLNESAGLKNAFPVPLSPDSCLFRMAKNKKSPRNPR